MFGKIYFILRDECCLGKYILFWGMNIDVWGNILYFRGMHIDVLGMN